MPKLFTSTGQINTSGSSRRATPTLFDSRAVSSIGSAVAGAGRIRQVQKKSILQDPLIDKVGPILKGEQIVDIIDLYQKRSLQIADNRNTVLANEALVTYKDAVRELNYGNEDTGVKGYLQTTGREASEGYPGYSMTVNKLTDETLNSLSPAVRQKVFPGINAHREASLNQAASYQVSQHKTWEKEVRDARYNASLTEASEYAADPLTGIQMHVAETRALYPNNPTKWLEARDEAADVMVKTAIATDPIAGASRGEKVANELYELVSAPQRLKNRVSVVQAKTKQQEMENARRAELRRQKTERQESNAVRLFTSITGPQTENVAPEILEYGVMQAISNGDIRLSVGQNLLKSIKEREETETDFSVYNQFMELIGDSTDGNIDINGESISLSEEVIAYPEGLTPSNKMSLLTRISNRKDTTFKQYQKDLDRFIEAQLGTGFSRLDRRFNYNSNQGQIMALAKTFASEALNDLRVSDNLNYSEVEKIRNQISLQFTKAKGAEVPLPRVYGSTVKPTSYKEVNAQLEKFNKLVSGGIGERGQPMTYTKGWVSSQMSIVNQWMAYYINQQGTQ